MKPAPFEYLAPDTLEGALSALGEHGESAKLLAGGQSLIPSMNYRVVQPSVLIDLNKLEMLRSTDAQEEGGIAVGAMTTQRQLELDPLVASRAPLLAEALPFIAHPQIRNRGTLGGSLAHADPAAELPVIAIASEARIRVRSGGKDRWIGARQFFQGMFMTDLAPDEILVEVVFPPPAPRSGWSFQEVSRRRGDYAMMGLAAVVELDESGNCQRAALVYLNAGDGPVEARQAAAALVGKPFDQSLQEAARMAAEAEIEPFGNVHATEAFQRHLARVLTERALTVAFDRARTRMGLA